MAGDPWQPLGTERRVSRRTALRTAGLGTTVAVSPLPGFRGSAVSDDDPTQPGLLSVLKLGCRPMGAVFNPHDRDVPWFGHDSQPALGGRSRFHYSGAHDESHVPGRHLLGLLEARSLGVEVPDEVIRKQREALLFGLSREVPLPQNRAAITERTPYRFITHNVREGLHGLFALYAHTPEYASQARGAFERSVAAIEEFWHPDEGWLREPLRARQPDIEVLEWGSPLITGIGRAIGPLTRFWRVSVDRGEESAPTRATLDRIVAQVLTKFPETGVDNGDLGTHTHSITCTLSGLAAYAHETGDADVMGRVRAFYRLGLTTIRDALGWSIENASDDSDRGECNNTGDILETALLLGHHGDPIAYDDAARILHGHLMPAQLRDSSWMRSPTDPWDDSERAVGQRLHGAFGFPAPYGHLPADWHSASFNLDIVGGAVSSLAFAGKAAVRDDDGELVVALPIDHTSELATVQAKHQPDWLELVIRPERAGPIRVPLPQWATPADVSVPDDLAWLVTPDQSEIVLRDVPQRARVRVRIRTSERTTHLGHARRDIRALRRGDRVLAMDNHGMPLAFFAPYPNDRREPGRGEIVRWTFADGDAGKVEATSGRARHRISLLSGASVEPLDGAPGGHGLRLTGDGAGATVGDPLDLNFGTAGFSVAVWVRTTMRGIGRVVSKGSYGWTPGYFLSVGHGGDGQVGFGIGGGATWGAGGSVECFTAEPLVGDGRWHHVCAAFDGALREIRLYVDGAARAIQRRAGTDGTAFGDVLRLRDTSPAVAASPLALTIGSHLGRQERFAGELCDLRFFGSGITADKVNVLIGQGNT